MPVKLRSIYSLHTLLNSKTGFQGFILFSYLCSGAWFEGARWNRLGEALFACFRDLCSGRKFENYPPKKSNETYHFLQLQKIAVFYIGKIW